MAVIDKNLWGLGVFGDFKVLIQKVFCANLYGICFCIRIYYIKLSQQIIIVCKFRRGQVNYRMRNYCCYCFCSIVDIRFMGDCWLW